MLLTSNRKKLVSYDKIYCTTNALVFLIKISRAVVSLFIVLDDLLTGLTEDIDILPAYQLADLHVCTIHGSQCYRTVEHKLHVSGSAGLFGCKRNLLGDIAGRDQLLCCTYVVVFHHNNLHVWRNFRIIVDKFL